MYEVRVKLGFSATHQIRLHDGQREPSHSHDWQVEAVFRGPQLDSMGVLIDFVEVQQALSAVVEPLRDTNLNETPLLASSSATAEQIARCIFEQLRQRLGPQSPLAAVCIQEAPGCVAAYWKPAL